MLAVIIVVNCVIYRKYSYIKYIVLAGIMVPFSANFLIDIYLIYINSYIKSEIQ